MQRDTCSATGVTCNRAQLRFRKIRAPIKIKSAPPPQKKGEFYGHGFSCRKNAFFQVSIKLVHPFPAPENCGQKILWTLRGFFWKIELEHPPPDWKKKKNYLASETPETSSGLFRTPFGPWGRMPPADSLGDLLGIPGPKSQHYTTDQDTQPPLTPRQRLDYRGRVPDASP